MSTNKKAMAFMRVARKDNDGFETHNSINAQRETIEHFSRFYGYDLVIEYSKIGSGLEQNFSWLDQKLHADASIQFLIVTSPDRICRSFLGFCNLKAHLLKTYGVEIIIVPKNPFLVIPSLN